MNKNILNYIEECEAWKVAIKNLHWSAKNMSQHELCDDIASDISDFEDLVSEVEQSISGKIKLNGFKPKSYEITSLKSFVEDVISSSQSFLKELEKMGNKYVGIKSECETFIGTMQRKLYLVNFTLKEELKRRLRAQIREGYRREENIKTVFRGNDPTTDNGVTKRLDAISKNGQFNSRVFDSMSDAFEFIQRHLENVGTLHSLGNMDNVFIVQFDANNGKSYMGMLHFMEVDEGKYKASLKFSNLGKENDDVDPEMSEPTIEDDYDSELEVENRMIRKQKGIREEDLSWGNKDLYWDEDSTARENGDDSVTITHKRNEYFKDPTNNDIEMRTSTLSNTTPKDFWKKYGVELNGGMAEEGREFKLSEDELKQVLKEAVIRIIAEKKGGIHIKKKNRGKFTATQKATGKSTEELTHSKNPLTRKRANFARMAKRGWKPLKKSE